MKPLIFLIGDSITEWGGDRSGWVDLLQKLTAASVDVINRGRGGWSTRWYLERSLAQDEAELSSGDLSPALITVWFGANDAVLIDHDPAGRHVPELEFRSNLGTILNRLRAVAPQAEILLITPAAVDDAVRAASTMDGVAERTNEAAGRYAKICVEVAQAENVTSIDMHTLFNSFQGAEFDALFADGLHLSDKGNRLVFDQLRIKIIEMLGEGYAFPEAY